MQELPELDIYRSMLAERFAGAELTALHIKQNKLTNLSSDQIIEEINGKTVWFVERRAQHLVFHLDNGKRLVIQISNQSYLYSHTPSEQYDISKAAITLQFGDRMLSVFGLRADDLQLMTVKAVEVYMKAFGSDPLDKRLTLNRFIEKFSKKRSSLKTALMDQTIIAGIGTVYSDEIAFAAGIRPDTKLTELNSTRWEQLYTAMGNVLREAISHGGAGLNPLFANDILTGGYSERFKVFDREGLTCTCCGETIVKITVGNRKAFACPKCQSIDE
ncbi:Fpg/Nei family DNA glycosylase [Paenibacillus sp. L3-i20]|uniref:Fpg/Nei family DNA glycosylase n=1 Tax=Paenibacillus sp. L3-i20 TaxID=2905833 RepID=UPI001EDF9669|nr:DNA-formamidopyrimidine glycosylase family protein [Paenibacillus sp. L3-i20]GKU79264.1 formamidopyrimidine-DNA glycosylase [Paenibacillus sp. L3-i20]